MILAWTGRHAWAIYKLNRGVGDTMFYDAAGHAWFPLDEQRRDVPIEQISTYFKDAVIAIEDHRYYSHSGIDPIARHAGGGLQPALERRNAGWQHDHAAARAHAVPVERADASRARRRKQRSR